MAHPSLRPASLRARIALLAIALLVAACGSNPTPSPASTVLSATATPTASPSESSGPSSTAPSQVTIVAAGDIACDPHQNKNQPTDCDQQATADEIGQLNPTALLPLGDLQYEDGTLPAFQSVFDKTWGRYKSIMHPAIGNHEYLTSGASGYFGYFDNIAPYYSFDLGSWHLIALDSECQFIGTCRPGSPEEKWLLNDLATHQTACTLVYWHEPRWSSGEHGDASQMRFIWNDLVTAHVDVVLTGHNHDYERFSPLNAAGRPDPSGVTEFVVGTGGKNHYGFVEPPLTGELVRNDTSFGVLWMALGTNGYSWKFNPAPGYTFTDSGAANCV